MDNEYNPLDAALSQIEQGEDSSDVDTVDDPAPAPKETKKKPATKKDTQVKKPATKATEKASAKKTEASAKGKPDTKKASAKKEAPAKKAATPAKKPAKQVVREAQPSQNGQTRPAPDTMCGKFWAICDAAARTKAGAVRKDLIEKAEEKLGMIPVTAATQFFRWRQFNGLVQKRG